MDYCTIKATADFKRVRGGARWAGASFAMEAKRRPEPRSQPARQAFDHMTFGQSGCPRFGFTVTRQIGNAVVRNRIRRRLKDAVRNADPNLARDGHDYVVVARHGAINRAFAELRREIEVALTRIYRQTGDQPRSDRSGHRTD